LSFFEELKRRNVFRVAIAYWVMAWLRDAELVEATRQAVAEEEVEQALSPTVRSLTSSSPPCERMRESRDMLSST